MKSFEYIVKDALGMHARPAGLLAREAKNFKSTVMIDNGRKKVNAGQLIGLMSMGIKQGEKLTVTIDGEDEERCLEAIKFFFEKNL